MNKKEVHVVPHTHWDREWYFTTSRSKIYLLHNLKKVLEQLEKNNTYNYFILDGQASLLDDYLAWRPEDRSRIKELVLAGKLIIGPWYTQTDQLVISAESIVRNMQYGIKICKEFGNYMNIGYVPDSFGQSAAMPQIYKSFNIEDTLFWRGVSDDQVKNTEYQWRGEDGSIVNVYQIPCGYYIGGVIPETDEEKLKTYLHEEPYKSVWSRSTGNHLLFPNGFDQAPPRENLPELIDKLNDAYSEFNFKISNYENYIRKIKASNPNLNVIEGELFNGKLSRVHKTIFSSRSDIKKINTEMQNFIVNTLEPLLTLAMNLGFEYPTGVMTEIWKLMFENAAHDSIGSCVSDNTNKDVAYRYKRVRELAENILELTLREISMRINSGYDITLTSFNSSGFEKEGVFETTLYVPQVNFAIKDEIGLKYSYTILNSEDQSQYILNQGNLINIEDSEHYPEKIFKVRVAIKIEHVPPLGYKTFHIDTNDSSLVKSYESDETFIENEFYKIKFNTNNLLDIFDKKSGHLYKDQFLLEENGDDGDSFNYSPPREDFIIYSSDFTPTISVLKSKIQSQITLSYQLIVPKNLEERTQKKATTILPVELTIKLKTNSPFIESEISIDNYHVDSHRLCLSIDTGIASRFSFADHQFGCIRRPVVRATELRLWEENKELWNEKPISIEPCQSFVALEGDKHSVALIPKSVREYEIIGPQFNIIRLTLFRTYGAMGKENLLYRPGRASGDTVILTPDAQCHKSMSFNLSLIYFNDGISNFNLANKINQHLKEVEFYQDAAYLNTRLRFVQTKVERYLPQEYSMLKITSNAILSLVNKAEFKDGIIFRFFNGDYHKDNEISLEFKQTPKLVQIVNLKDERINELPITNNTVTVSNLKHNKFITIYVEF